MCEMWEAQEILYDITHEDYRDSDKRKDALDGIAEFFELTGQYQL